MGGMLLQSQQLELRSTGRAVHVDAELRQACSLPWRFLT